MLRPIVREAIPLLAVSSVAAFFAEFARADVDLQPIGVEFVRSGAGLYDVSPRVLGRSNDSGEFPGEFDLYVNGDLVATSRSHNQSITTPCNPATPPCSGECTWTVSSGNRSEKFTGTCVQLRADMCHCAAAWTYWSIQSVSLDPGDQVTVVSDPRDLVAEFDEDNNTLTVVFAPPIPTITEWGIVALASLLAILGVAIIVAHQGSRTSSSHRKTSNACVT